VYACVEENNQSRDPQIHWITVLRSTSGSTTWRAPINIITRTRYRNRDPSTCRHSASSARTPPVSRRARPRRRGQRMTVLLSWTTTGALAAVTAWQPVLTGRGTSTGRSRASAPRR
jgi:hypothetical protein